MGKVLKFLLDGYYLIVSILFFILAGFMGTTNLAIIWYGFSGIFLLLAGVEKICDKLDTMETFYLEREIIAADQLLKLTKVIAEQNNRTKDEG